MPQRSKVTLPAKQRRTPKRAVLKCAEPASLGKRLRTLPRRNSEPAEKATGRRADESAGPKGRGRVDEGAARRRQPGSRPGEPPSAGPRPQRRLVANDATGVHAIPQFSKSGAYHPIDPRLVTLLGDAERPFRRPRRRGRQRLSAFSTADSSRATRTTTRGGPSTSPFEGVANETLRDFCRRLRNVGVGYYPNSRFVHLDVRDRQRLLGRLCRLGQAPRYRAGDARTKTTTRGTRWRASIGPGGASGSVATRRAPTSRAVAATARRRSRPAGRYAACSSDPSVRAGAVG